MIIIIIIYVFIRIWIYLLRMSTDKWSFIVLVSVNTVHYLDLITCILYIYFCQRLKDVHFREVSINKGFIDILYILLYYIFCMTPEMIIFRLTVNNCFSSFIDVVLDYYKFMVVRFLYAAQKKKMYYTK